MDYREKAKKTLSDYIDLKVCIENIKLELDALSPSVSGVRYGKEPVQTSGISSPTESETERLEAEQRRLERELKLNEAIVERVDRCLDALRDGQRRILVCRHMRCMSWDETSGDTGYCVSQCKRIYKRAIYRVSVGLYGERARHSEEGRDL